MKKRLQWVDFLKGLGIILVVYGHVILGIHDANVGFNGFNYEIQHSIVYTVHMPLFFFLSGLFAQKWATRNIKIAFLQKAKSLLVPYFIWGIVQGIIMSILASITNNGTSWKSILLLPIKPFAQFWFLYDLFFIFILYYFLKKVLNDKYIFLVSLVFSFLAPQVSFWQLEKIMYYFLFFILGTLFIKMNIYDKVSKKLFIPVLLICISSNYLLFMLKKETFLYNVGTLIVAIIGIVFVILLSNRLNSKAVCYLGEISLPIYLMHIMATAGTRIILIKIFNIDDIMINIILGTILGIGLPVIAYRILEYLRIAPILFMEK